jgi:hypothetical protein
MNLTQLNVRIQGIINRCRNPDEVVVGVRVVRLGAVGGTSIAEVTTVFKGIDWDNNKLIIDTGLDLREADRDELTKLKKDLSDIGWTAYEFNNLKRENAKLRKQLAELQGDK